MNTSATGGFLVPTSADPSQDKDLDLDLQAIVVGITGLCGNLVRRRYQPVPGKQPDATENWCAIGVMSTTPEAGAPAVEHYSTGLGYDRLRRHEVLDVLASFYGPASIGYASMLRDGLYLAQNREALYALSMGLIDTETLINSSYLQNAEFLRKVDLHFRLRRRIERDYSVLNIEGAVGEIQVPRGSASGPTTQNIPIKVER